MNLRVGCRHLKLKSGQIEAPCVVPSFSSRARAPETLQLSLENTLGIITMPILVSAYDLYHRAGLVDIAYDVFAEIDEASTPALILDSGGYEVLWNKKAVEAGIFLPEGRRPWSEVLYYELLESWEAKTELVAVTYDDDTRMAMPDQLARARNMVARFPWLTVDFLLKPVGRSALLLVSEISPYVKDLAEFSVIGVTEKEMGESMSERLVFLAGLRDCLSKAGLQTPIHVFGGLDPSMTPLYFMAGADIFDGLSWLRYALTATGSLYEQSHVSVAYPAADLSRASWKQRRSNLIELGRLKNSMSLLASGVPIEEAFGERSRPIMQAWEQSWYSG